MRKLKPLYAGLGVLLVSGALTGCLGDNSDDNTPEADRKLGEIIKEKSLKGDPTDTAVAAGVAIPSLEDPKVKLGKMLFFSKDMSFSKDVACVSCHHPVLGAGDNLALPVGVDPVNPDIFGPGRFRKLVGSGAGTDQIPGYTSNGVVGNPAMPRNSPTVFGLAFWDKAITWDGTVFSEKGTPGKSGIDSRIIAPIDLAPVNYSPVLAGVVGTRFDFLAQTSVNYADKFDSGMLLSAGHGMFPASVKPAMRGVGYATNNPATSAPWTDLEIRKDMASRFNNATWLPMFRDAYPGIADANLATPNNISTAIASYERTMTMTLSPWRSYVKGDKSALTDSQKRGAMLFFNTKDKGGANCASCHSGDFFTDEDYYVLAVPQVGRGKADNNGGGDNNDDWGRAHVTGIETDKYAYRVPTLLNVEVTGPYGHSGVFNSLEGVIRHHLNAANSVAAFDFNAFKTWADPLAGPIDITRASSHTQLALNRLQAQRASGQDVLQDVALTDAQVSDLVNFMKALTDPCTKDKACMSKWVPSDAENAFDTQRVCPRDKDGVKLMPGSC